MLQIRNGDGAVLMDNIQTPACFFDKETFTLMKIGEKVTIERIYNQYRAAFYKNGAGHMADDLVMVDLPKDQELIDNIVNISGYCKNLLPQ